MKRIAIASAMSLWVLSLAAILSADTLIMRDGSRVQGTLEGFATRTITFRHADGVSRRYRTSQVKAVEFLSAERANPRAVSGLNFEAPAGSELVVRTVETIDSRNVAADQAFSAIVEQEVTNAAGEVIVPRRSSAQLTIREIALGGERGSPELALEIQSITVAGRRYLVSTAEVTRESDAGTEKNRRAAAAAIGIGAIVDAAGRGGVQVLTEGRHVRVPAETVLTFRLDKPVMLRPEPER
jgi:hypothetical protein